MDRLKQKQLQKLKQEKQLISQELQNILKHKIMHSQKIQNIIKYAEQYLKNNIPQDLIEFSPTHISRLIFDGQLKMIKNQLSNYPNQQINLQHFIIIMLNIMNFPFQKTPFYMIGLKDMFYEIAEQNQSKINYKQIFKYVLGEVVNIKQQQQNTQFQVQLQQKKKQDYLLHDNGIKKIKYSKDLKILFSFDQKSNSIKIYDQDMKNISKFSPRKQKHHNKFPYILDFQYSQINSKMCILFSDQTVSIVDFHNFHNKSQSQFQMGQIVTKLPQKIKNIYFIQMLNKWLLVAQQSNKNYMLDHDKITHEHQKSIIQIDLHLSNKIVFILQILSMSCICIINGSQIVFLNENLTQQKYNKFIHVEQILKFKYIQQNLAFYVIGKQKHITAFSLNRNGNINKIWAINYNKIILDFQIFPFYNTIAIIDESNQLILMNQQTQIIYQKIQYKHICKNKDKNLNIFKISKNQLIIFQTYMIILAQQKVAIQKDITYNFIQHICYDNIKSEVILSVNNLIINFSLLSGEIRKSYTNQNSNLDKHNFYHVSNKCPLFLFDNEFNIYQIYQKDLQNNSQNKTYKKKINIIQTINCFYDNQFNILTIVGKNIITHIRNDKNNCFNFINQITLSSFGNILSAKFCQKTKILSFLSSNGLIYQYKYFQRKITKSIQIIFPNDENEHQTSFLSWFDYDYLYNIFIIFTTRGEVYFIDQQTNNQLYFNSKDHLPSKLKHILFSKCKYQLFEQKKNILKPYIILTDQTGFIIRFQLSKIFQENGFKINNQIIQVYPIIKQSQRINNQNVINIKYCLKKDKNIRKSYSEVGLMKAHDKSIVIVYILNLEITVTLTISVDGRIKLWNNSYQCLSTLKLPTLSKQIWNMKQIQKIKNKNCIDELFKLFNEHYSSIINEKRSPLQIVTKTKRLRQRPSLPKINFQNPIKIDIQNKDIQQIIHQKQDYYTFYPVKQQSKTFHLFNTQKVTHPWRKKKQFIKIIQKASPNNKYKQIIPKNLVQLRKSLDMIQQIKDIPNYKQAQKILPQLKFYQQQQQKSIKQKKQIQNQQQIQNFQSCLYIKSQPKRKKRVNEFDEIDKEFKKKQMILTARKWVPKQRKQRTNSFIQPKSQILSTSQGKTDPIKEISKIFEKHNRQCMQQKKGRLIKIPKINIQKQLF